jgi:hypothetical protein
MKFLDLSTVFATQPESELNENTDSVHTHFLATVKLDSQFVEEQE